MLVNLTETQTRTTVLALLDSARSSRSAGYPHTAIDYCEIAWIHALTLVDDREFWLEAVNEVQGTIEVAA